MSNATPFCPTCGTGLTLSAQGEFHPWVCPNGHGLAATLSAGYGKVQDDELHQLWNLAKTAAAGPHKCPMCEQPMVVVDLGWDADEVPEGTAGDGPDEGHEQLDVCREDEVIWFDTGELEALPADIANPEPSAEDQAKIQQIADTFVNEYIDDEEGRIHDTLTDKMYRHIAGTPRRQRVLSGLHFFGQGTTSLTN